MINNPGIQNTALVAWNGTTSFPRDIKNHVDFGFVFEVRTTLVADAVFVAQGFPESDADPCVPGAGVDVLANPVCQAPLVAGALAEFRIPAGTPAGTVCAGTIPCRPGRFVGVRHVSGGANVWVNTLLQGPKR